MATPNGLNPSFEEVTVGGIVIEAGAGAPTHTRAKGSLYMRTDGSSTSTRMYVNTDGAGTWTNVVTGA